MVVTGGWRSCLGAGGCWGVGIVWSRVENYGTGRPVRAHGATASPAHPTFCVLLRPVASCCVLLRPVTPYFHFSFAVSRASPRMRHKTGPRAAKIKSNGVVVAPVDISERNHGVTQQPQQYQRRPQRQQHPHHHKRPKSRVSTTPSTTRNAIVMPFCCSSCCHLVQPAFATAAPWTAVRLVRQSRLLVLASSALCVWFTVQLSYSIFLHHKGTLKTAETSWTISPPDLHPDKPIISICETTKVTAANDDNNATASSSIAAYLSRMEHPEDWLLLKWNPDGSFDSAHAQTKTLFHQWAPSVELLNGTTPSPWGRVVLLFNSDRVPQVPWDIYPPAPVWVYSKPNSAADPRRWNITEPIVPCALDQVTVVPTPYDIGTWNAWCVQIVNQKMTKHNFTDKINQVVWRGAVHSKRVEQSRTALLEYSRRFEVLTAETAVGDNNNNNSATTSNSNNTYADESWLNVREVNKKGEAFHMELYELANYRYHLDLGGVSGTAWGGLRWKLCTGLLVFKVQSWSDDWWYDTLVPWVHYIPIRADVADLHEQYQWTQDHPEQTEAIAHAGRAQCLATFGSEVAKDRYRAIVQSIPAASQAMASEADDILEQLRRLDTDMAGLPSIASVSIR